MEFRILGPLEVLENGRQVVMHRGKEQALLAYLLLHANELVPTDRLIDELWGERPPATVRKNLQNAVSQLRKVLGDDRLLTEQPGYRLRLERGELDLHRFEDLARAGRENRDAEQLREALAVWRGELLTNLRDEFFVQRAAGNLEEARLGVLEDRLDADLAAGRDAELVPELERLISAQPLRERLYAQLMLALYRAGRQADALDVYRRARRTLSDEVGLEPSRELQTLERQILNHDPALAPQQRAQRPRAGSRSRRTWLLGAAVAAAVVVGVLAAISFAGSGDGTLPVVPNSLVKIDASSNEIVDVIRVGHQPIPVAAAGDSVWVASGIDQTVTRVDAHTGETFVQGGQQHPTDLVAEDEDTVWISTATDRDVVRLNGMTLLPEIHVPLGHTAFLLAVGAGSLWVSQPADAVAEPGTVARVSLRTAKIEDRFHVGALPAAIAVGARAAWVTNVADGSVSRIALDDGATARVNIGAGPVALGFDSVWLGTNDSVLRLDAATRQPEAVRKLQGRPQCLYVDTEDEAVWVTVREAGTLVRIDPRTNEVVKTIRVGYKPNCVAAHDGTVWVTVGAGELQLPF